MAPSMLPLTAAVAALLTTADATQSWRMLDQYPNQYVTRKLAPDDAITIDGKLDEPAWADAEWTYNMVDITRHADQQLNAVPNDLQARAKIRWDDDYVYIGALLHEVYVTAVNVGHNSKPPYSPDNDFEIFIDVSGTTQYYMEFEMSAQNATYDIKWGKPDGSSVVACATNSSSWPALPSCYNSSFASGGWTMATKVHPGDTNKDKSVPALMNASLTPASRGTTAWAVAEHDTGMVAATAWVPQDYEKYTFPSSQWTAEIRFPIRQTPNYSTQAGGYPLSHGGLIDADPVRQKVWDQYDPSNGDAGPGRPRYWWVDFASAQHTKKYTFVDGSYEICPFNCTAALEHAVNVTSGYAESASTHRRRLYREYVWGAVGDANPGVGYMHRPSSWPLIQFANSSGEPLCRNIEFPGRHVAKSIHLAQTAYARYHNGSFASEISTLRNSTLCNLDLGTSDTCDLDALTFAMFNPEVFKLGMQVTENVTQITRACPTRPCCYMASVQVTVPTSVADDDSEENNTAHDEASPYVYTVSNTVLFLSAAP
jgi:hypothetical protein